MAVDTSPGAVAAALLGAEADATGALLALQALQGVALEEARLPPPPLPTIAPTHVPTVHSLC